MSKTGVVVVSGGASGIGLEIARGLARDGFTPFLLGRAPHKLEVAAAETRAGFYACDLSLAPDSGPAVEAIQTYLIRTQLPLRGLVNNAGIFERVSFEDSSDELWTQMFQNNLLSAVRLTRLLSAELKASPSASVLNISSTLGLRSVANTSAYAALKAAMVSWTRSLALEWAAAKIRVNCICPGLIDTPIHAFHGQEDTHPDRQSAHRAQPLGRLGRPEDIAEMALFLLSDKAAWTTGSIVTIDGGISL